MPHGKSGISFSDEVAAGSTETESHQLDRPATVESISVRIYPGPGTDLEIEPFVKTNDGTRRPLLDYAGKQFVDGDDDVYSWSVSEPVEQDATLEVRAKNTDASNPYNYRVNMDVDYREGSRSVLSGFGGLF